MCGITGVINLKGCPVEPEELKTMTKAIRHRGPDGEAFWANGSAGFGHTRLAIMDLSENAAQPMASLDRRFLLVFNGEIYNYLELREELRRKGYRFRSTGDTEVLLYALIEWGEKAVKRFNGMFAFGFWDTQRQELLLGRDRYGIKPLYICHKNGLFVFGSEIKAILAHPSIPTNIDLEGLLEYFTFQNFFSKHTLFRDVYTFPAGNTMRISLQESKPVFHRYWDFSFADPEFPLTEEEYCEELGQRIEKAVKRQLMGDVEIGAYLSGGMDSGTITYLAAQGRTDFKTFTCGFDLLSASGLELYSDERAKAEHMAYHCKTEHYQVVLKAGDMERALPHIVHHMDEPRVGQSYPNFYAAKLAGKFVKGVLTGTGGDELLAGYPWRYYRASKASTFEEFIDHYYSYWQRLIPNREIRKVFAPVWKDVSHIWTRDIFRNVFNGHANELQNPEDYINHSLYFEAKTFLHGLLIMEDKLSMAHGLESRVPFLDNDLVDFASQTPLSLKLGNLGQVDRINENEPTNKVERFFHQSRDGKQILRKTMSRYIPPSITEARKQGFSGPDGSWFKGDSIQLVRRRLFDEKARMYDFLDNKSVQALVEEHLSGKTNRRLLIWSLLHFEEWLQHFLT